MMSFSPPQRTFGSSHHGPAAEAALLPDSLSCAESPQRGQVADTAVVQASNCLMGTSPAKKTGDASDRKPVGKVRLGGAAAGGDASQRNPTGRMSLGVAVLGGDASQRSPPGCTNLVGATPKNQMLC